MREREIAKHEKELCIFLGGGRAKHEREGSARERGTHGEAGLSVRQKTAC